MTSLKHRLSLGVLGILVSLSALGQGTGRGSTTSTQRPAERSGDELLALLPGRWELEFRIDYFSKAPDASGRYLKVIAYIYVSGDEIEGKIRETDITGEFRCSWDGVRRCQGGTMRFQGEEQDWPDFGFAFDRYNDSATGWAEWIDVRTGEIQRFELRLRKR